MIISILPHPFIGLCCFEEEKLFAKPNVIFFFWNWPDFLLYRVWLNNSRLESNETRQADISEIKLNSANLGLNDPNTNVLPFPRGGIDTRNLEKFRKEN